MRHEGSVWNNSRFERPRPPQPIRPTQTRSFAPSVAPARALEAINWRRVVGMLSSTVYRGEDLQDWPATVTAGAVRHENSWKWRVNRPEVKYAWTRETSS